MKNILKIVCLFITINVSCQVTQIVPLHTIDHPIGAYMKDLDNQLPYFVGTWEGTANNIQYTFEFTVFPQVLIDYENGMYWYRDKLEGKYEAVNLITNQILFSNLNAANYEDYMISETGIWQNQEFSFFYMDEDHCFNTAGFKLVKNLNNLNEVTYKGFELKGFGSPMGCPEYESQDEIPLFLPTTEFVLTKQ
tara:strand:+ start:168361 stop:168939 length:579 start_codon:yes stop_codon:yes gene_type:complete